MNVNQKIEQALSGVVTEIYPLTYPYDESKPDIYIVYNPELDTPGLYADDEDQEWMQYMQIHLYKKGNYIEKRKEIKEKLRENGNGCNGHLKQCMKKMEDTTICALVVM